jgi:DNA-directed RNA polymerase specialized sigma24 family protein
VLLGDGTRSSVTKDRPELANPADIGAFCEREMPRLVLFVTVSTSLDIHAAADVAQVAFEKALPRWSELRNPRAWLCRVAWREALARREAGRREVPVDAVPEWPDQLRAAANANLREISPCLTGILGRCTPRTLTCRCSLTMTQPSPATGSTTF